MHIPLWYRVLAFGGLLVLVALAAGSASWPVVRAIAAVMMLVLGFRTVRRNPGPASRPWAIVLAGGALALMSAVVRLIHGIIIDVNYAYPSPADLLAFLSYLVIIAGVNRFVTARSVERYRSDVVDGVLVSLLGGLLIYAFVLSDYVADSTIPPLHRAGNVGYSILTLMLIGAVAQVAFGPGTRNRSYYLMAAAAFLIVANDVLLLLDTAGRPGAYTAASFAAPLAFVFAAAALAHPGALQLADRPEYRGQRLTRARLLLLLVALGTGPVLLVLDRLRDSAADLAIILAMWVALAFGVTLRMVLLVTDRERSSARDRSLRDLAGSFTSLRSSDELVDACLNAGYQLTGSSPTTYFALYEAQPSGFVLRGSAGAPIERSLLEITTAESEAVLVAGLAADSTTSLEQVAPLGGVHDRADSFVVIAPVHQRAADDRAIVVTSYSVIGREQVAVIASLAGQLGLALDGLALSEQLHQKRSDRRFRALVENSSDVVIVVDDQACATFVSPTVRRLLGREESDVMGGSVFDLVYRGDQESVRRLLAAPSRTTARHASVEVRMLHGGGELRWFELEARNLTEDPEVEGVVVTASDVSDRKRAESQLLRSEARFRLLVQNTSDVVAIIDENALFTYVSPSVEHMLGFGIAEILGRNVFELMSVTEAERIRSLDLERLDGGTIEVRVQGGDGRIRVVEVAITDMRDQPEIDGTVLNIRDITDRKSLEDDLRHQALHDDLTGLANRTLFTDRVTEAVNSAARTSEVVGVLFVDLDDFKLINDSLGHVVGDQVLVTVADRIQQCLRLSDMAARLGGDEFAVLLTGVYGETEITEVADRIRDAIGQGLTVSEHDFRLTASIGVVVESQGERNGEDLLRSADMAMYQAKQDGGDRHELFESQMEVSAVEQLELKSALLRAVENDEFILHYQPIVEMGSARIKGVEALLRWEDPNRGMVSPASFIPAAEETGLIREIGMWVARQATTDLARWRADGHDLYCSINVSGRQMMEEDFAQQFIDVVAEAGVDGDAVVVELTESVLAVPGTQQMFEKFHAEGFRIALDDFGTGYSALQYLQTFDIDLIKIDRSFVTALGETKDTSMVQAVLDVAASISATTLAEGIEDTTELQLLKSLGVELAQGYYFSKPLPEDQLLVLLSDEFATNT